MTYAIIKVGGKQYRVREGERLLVDRLAEDDGSTFAPTVLLVGGNGEPVLDGSELKVTAKVLGAVKGPKIRIGKYKKRTGYRRHNGFRSSLTQIEIESIGAREREVKETVAAQPKATTTDETVERVKGMPSGYEDLTVAQIKDAAPEWSKPMLAAALEYEQEHSKRKGAIAAIESEIADKESES